MNNPINKLLNKRFLVVFFLVIFAVFLVNYVLEHSRLEIQNTTSEDVVLFLEDDVYQRKIELKPQEKIDLRLKKSTYSLEATSADKQTKYIVELDHLFKKTFLGVDLKSVNAGIYLGESQLRCARKISNRPVFYSCSPSNEGLIESGGAVGLSPSLEKRTSSGEGDEEISEETAKFVIKPYKNVFLEAKKVGNAIFISKRGVSGYTAPAIIKIENFASEISDSAFSVDEAAGMYAVLDEENSQIIYGGVDLKEQKHIDYSRKKIDPHAQKTMVGVGGGKIYLVAIRSSEHIENHLEPEEEDKDISPQIVVYGAATEKEQKVFKLDESATLSGVSFGPGGLVYFIANKSAGEGGGAFFSGADNKLVSFKNYGNGANPPCWADKNTFYYVDVEGDSIYKYSVAQKAAYLIYQNNNAKNFISGISCSDQALYFSIDSQLDEELDTFSHYLLGDQPQTGRPAEEVLPKYFEVGDATFKASLVGTNKILIELVHNYDSERAVDQNRVKKALKDELGFEGVNLSGITFKYSD